MRLSTEKRVHFPFDKLLSNCPNLIELNSTAFDRICWNWKKLPSFIGLETLTLTGWSNVKMSKMIIEKCSNLKSLGLGCTKMSKNAINYKTNLQVVPTSLVSLKLHGGHYTIQNIREFMITKGFNLETFMYSSCLSQLAPSEPHFFTLLIQILFSNCPNLQKIELKLVDHSRFGPLQTLVPLAKLKQLIIKSDQKDFNHVLLEKIIANCPSLSTLIIVSNYIDLETSTELVQKYCSKIQSIQVQPFSLKNLFDLSEDQVSKTW